MLILILLRCYFAGVLTVFTCRYCHFWNSYSKVVQKFMLCEYCQTHTGWRTTIYSSDTNASSCEWMVVMCRKASGLSCHGVLRFQFSPHPSPTPQHISLCMSGVRIPAAIRDFFSETSRPALGHNQLRIQLIPGFPGLKRPERTVDHSSSCSAKVKN